MRLLLGDGQRRGTKFAERRTGFLQFPVQPHPLVEHETLSPEVGITDCFEIFQDASLQLIDFPEALLKQQRGGFLAADAAGAEHYQRFIPGLRRHLLNRFRKLAE